MNEEKIDNHQIYNEKWAGWVDMKIYGPASRWLRSLISNQISTMDKGSVKSILDVGSGEGTITHFMAQKLPDAIVLGIDFSESGIECSRASYQLPNLSFEHDLDSHALEKKYDLVTAFEVLEHVDDWQNLLGRMASASQKYLLLSFPTGRMRPFEKNVGHVRNFKKGEVEEFLTRGGVQAGFHLLCGFPFLQSTVPRVVQSHRFRKQSIYAREVWGCAKICRSFLLYILQVFFITKEIRRSILRSFRANQLNTIWN